MTTRVRTLTFAVAAVFGATAIALAAVPLIDQFADIGAVASAYAKDEGGAAGGHTSGETGSSSGGHASGGGSDKGGASGGHTSGGGADKGGGHTSGGHTSGGGADKGGGHTSGGGTHGGGPNTASHRYGLERSTHGTKPGHEGHASGVHGQNAQHGSSVHGAGADRRFGGGNGIAGMEQVPEGPARFAGSSMLTQSASSEPGPKFRFRYWGGWDIPDDPNDVGTVVVEAVDVPATPVGGGGGPLAKLSLASAARCDDVGANMPSRSFFSAANLARLDAARTEIDPDALASRRGLDPTLMANVQEELVDGRADPVLVGTYLGMMTRTPVSPEMVKRVAFRLCAPMTDEMAGQIAQAAEEVRVVANKD
jgi:hypothetical protein